ncbi:MAG: hypothetical protein ACK42D_02355 [Candidatus Paceibacteria bacterium]
MFDAEPDRDLQSTDDRMGDELASPAVGFVPVVANPVALCFGIWLEMSYLIACHFNPLLRRR